MKEENKKNNLVILIILGLVIASGAFGGGIFVGKKTASTKRNIGQGLQQQGQQRQMRGGFRPVNGEIISADEKSVTLKLTDGSSKIILLSEKTQINKAQSATVKDLTTGEKVMIMGQENSDGSISAANVQINPLVKN